MQTAQPLVPGQAVLYTAGTRGCGPKATALLLLCGSSTTSRGTTKKNEDIRPENHAQLAILKTKEIDLDTGFSGCISFVKLHQDMYL